MHRKKNYFNIIHRDFPDMLSKVAYKNKIEKFLHVSALGIENALESKYCKKQIRWRKKV